MCNVSANTSQLVRSLRPQRAPGGGVYYQFDYDVVLLFGLTELKAQISWMHEVRLVIVLSRLYSYMASRVWRRGENNPFNSWVILISLIIANVVDRSPALIMFTG